MYEVLLEALQEGNYSFSMILGKQVYDNDKSYSIPSAYTKSILTQEIMIKSLFNHIHPQQGMVRRSSSASSMRTNFINGVCWISEFSKDRYRRYWVQLLWFIKILSSCHNRYPHVLLGTTTTESITSKGKSPFTRPCRSYYLCLQNIPKENTVYRGCCLKSFSDDNQREVSCVKHALPASGTPCSEKD